MSASYVLCAQSSAGRPQRGELDVVQSLADVAFEATGMANFGECGILEAKRMTANKRHQVVKIAVKTVLLKGFGG